MQCPRRADPAQGKEEHERGDVDRREVREDGIRLDALDRLDHALEQMLQQGPE
jgi:hypothetical protein